MVNHRSDNQPETQKSSGLTDQLRILQEMLEYIKIKYRIKEQKRHEDQLIDTLKTTKAKIIIK